MRCQETLIGSCIALLVLGLADRAGAAHLVKVDEQVVQQGPAQADQASDQVQCPATGTFFGLGAGFTLQTLFVDVGSRLSVAGTDCDQNDSKFTDTATATGTIVADAGDNPGPVVLCYSARYDVSADSVGGFTGTSLLGGATDPVTGAATITQSPGAITIFSVGLLTLTSGRTRNSESGQFTANVGDTITLKAGDSTEINGSGTGSATAESGARLSVRLGSCVGEGAPAVSHVGLGLLIALLGGLGMLTLARRRTLAARVDR